MTGVFLSAPRYDRRAPLSHPSSCMLVSHRPSQLNSKRRIQAMEMRCYRKILRISYRDHVTNNEVRAKIQQAIGPHEDLRTVVKRHKLKWCGHVSRSSGNTVLQGTVKGGRRQGGQRKKWEDNIREWTGVEFARSQRAVGNREKWRKLVAKSSVVPKRPSRLRDSWNEMRYHNVLYIEESKQNKPQWKDETVPVFNVHRTRIPSSYCRWTLNLSESVLSFWAGFFFVRTE